VKPPPVPKSKAPAEDVGRWGSKCSRRFHHCGWKNSCTTWDGRKPINNGKTTYLVQDFAAIHHMFEQFN